MTSSTSDPPRRLSEFALIAKLFAPLAAKTEGAFGLTDDAATLDVGPDQDLVLTVDALVEGVHFLKTDPPDAIAKKALRVNLSDLAAKGAVPIPGAKNARQAADNAGALRWELDAGEVDALDQVALDGTRSLANRLWQHG